MWTLNFEAHGYGYVDEPEKIVGKITAIWNAGLPDEFTVESKINLGDDGAVDDFIAEAEKIKIEKTQGPSAIAEKIGAILDRMNEK